MRALCLLVLLVPLGGCSVLDYIANAPRGSGYDPSKIYLGDSTVLIAPKEADRYACTGRPMLCERIGARLECRCAY